MMADILSLNNNETGTWACFELLTGKSYRSNFLCVNICIYLYINQNYLPVFSLASSLSFLFAKMSICRKFDNILLNLVI